jgi:uncharacterized repeat protein (TIGR03803 family)
MFAQLFLSAANADITFTSLNSFKGTNGSQPFGTLLRGTNGLFYGTTAHGGDFDNGIIFSATTSGVISNLASFDGTNGAQPLVGLTQTPDGSFYGAASAGGDFGLGTIFSFTTNGVLTNLVSFNGTNGARPLSPLLLGIDGNLYGTTSLGGSSNTGTVFLLTPTGIVTLVSFVFSNGAQPSGNLAQGADGTIYGTTSAGGAYGYGTIFSLNTLGVLTTLKSFTGGADGGGPQGGLIMASDGVTLYGTTASGGINNVANSGSGTIFSINTAGTFTSLHSFAPGEGANPFAPLFQAGNGILYGTTTGDGAAGLGTVFTFRAGVGFTNVHSLVSADGTSPHAGLAAGTNGNLFGVTTVGGRNHVGTIYQLSGLAPFIIIGPSNQTVLEGDSVSFSVLAGGSAPFTFQWLFNSNNVANSKVVAGARTSTLTLTSATTAASGFYSVLIQNSEGLFLSVGAQLNVIPVPTIRITSPGSKAVVKTAQVTVAGATGGDAVVARVYFQLNGGGWQLATTSDNWAHWKAVVTPITGTNEVDAFAESVIGTYSTTNTVFFYSPPFVPIQGAYNGLFSAADGFSPDSAGFLSLTLNYKGGFSGRVQMAGLRSSFSGQFDSNGDAAVIIRRGNVTPLNAALHLELAEPDDRITGTITDGSWVAYLLANRAVFDARTNPAPGAGRYTLSFPGAADASVAPGGDSYGTLTLATSGRLTATVSLSDNTKFTQTVPLAEDGTWPFFAPLYSGKGLIQGWMSLTNVAPSVLGGDLNWYKPALPSAKFYSTGFTLMSTTSGGFYQPTNLVAVFGVTNVQLVLAGGDLPEAITNQVAIDSRNRITDLSGDRLSLSFSQSSGTFQGSLTEADTKQKLLFQGVIRQDLGIGDGFFLGTNQTGQFLLLP